MKDTPECGFNSGEMSKPCALTLELAKKEIQEENLEEINEFKEEHKKEIEGLKTEINDLRNDIRDLKSQKADDKALQAIREELIEVKEKLTSISNDYIDNKTAINRLADQIAELFKIINEYNYENGQVIEKVENFAINQAEMMTIIKNIRIPTVTEQVNDWINRGKHKKLRKGCLIAFAVLVVGVLLSALTFYTGQGITFKDVLDILKELIS